MKKVIILGSSASKGNTRKVVDRIIEDSSVRVVDLNNYNISYFDYKHENQGDDFIPLIEELLAYEEWVFATPVYWYAMSAVMKTFFDRLSDLLKIRKDLGRRLRGKSMGLIACSSDGRVYDWFDKPFSASAEYLGMKFTGMTWSWVEEDKVNIRDF